MKKLFLLTAVLLLLTSCFIAIRVPSEVRTLLITNTTDAPVTVSSRSFRRYTEVTVPASSSIETEVYGFTGEDIILNMYGKYFSGEKGLAVEANASYLRCTPIPDIGWVRVVNSSGMTLYNVRVAGQECKYDKNGKEYLSNHISNGQDAYAPVHGKDLDNLRNIVYEYWDGTERKFVKQQMPKAGKTETYYIYF